MEGMVAPSTANLPYLGQSRDQAAEMVNVSHGYVSDAKRVQAHAPEAFEGLRAGTVTIPQAVANARAPEEDRSALTAQAVERHTVSAANARACGIVSAPACMSWNTSGASSLMCLASEM